MHLQIVTLYIAVAINVILGLLVFYRKYRETYGWLFAITLLFVALWAVGDIMLLSKHDGSALDVTERLFYVGPMVIPISILFFGLVYPARRIRLDVVATGLIWLFGTGLPILINPGLIINSVTISRPFNIPHPSSPGFIFYTLYFSVTFMAAYAVIFRSYRSERNLSAKVQLRYTLLGLISASVPALITNLSLPLAGHGGFIWMGPLFTTVFVVAIGLSIVQHGMFDIRLVIARSIGYVLSLAFLVTVYALIVFGLGGLVFGVHFSLGSQVYLLAVAAIAGLCFARLKRVFDRTTMRLFYHDAYDAQDLYDRLNQILVSTLETGKLLNDTSELLKSTFKSDFVVIGLKETESRPQQIVGALPGQKFDSAVHALRKLTIKYPHAVLATDYLEATEGHIKEILEQNDVAVLVRLAPNVVNREEGFGYIAFGHKKSGNPYNPQDLRVLDVVANELIIAVQNTLHFEEIQTFNTTLQQRIHDATSKLRQTNTRLKQLNETKDDFVSMASHQLRTPLTSVEGYLSMVLEGDAGPLNEQQRKLLEQSFNSSRQMVYLISDLLNISRISTGRFVIEPSEVQLDKIVEEEVSQLNEIAKAREVSLTYEKPPTFPKLMLDETKMHQVVMNFIDNAVHYTRPGGSVTVSLRETPSAIEYTVKDTGIGVPKAARFHLFTKFYRAPNAQKTRPDGTGLGLFMAKKVVTAQGGAIIFHSEEGKGSTFGFRLPKAGHLAPEA